jgi:hypothetical protein
MRARAARPRTGVDSPVSTQRQNFFSAGRSRCWAEESQEGASKSDVHYAIFGACQSRAIRSSRHIIADAYDDKFPSADFGATLADKVTYH